ncbi:MAG: 50S ribosomal protein L22 [Phycisphaeraceae bacterium]|nr:50S ribosomal protein L22 [Phycisphaeraceae bacterium]
MAFTNTHRGVRISPKKVMPLIPLIRGMRIDEAVTMLTFSKRRAAIYIKQALLAAKANADQAEADVRRLVVTEARVDSGPTMKRFQPKDRGRSHRILKRTSHITVSVDVK